MPWYNDEKDIGTDNPKLLFELGYGLSYSELAEDAGGECPEELKVLDDPDEGYIRCIVCGDIFPENECIEIDEGIAFCRPCYKDEHGGR